MCKRLLFLLAVSSLTMVSFAQDKWDLRRCVEYALANNITIKQANVQALNAELDLKQQKANQIPSLNFNGNLGYRFGRSENPTTGVLEDNNFLNSGMQLQSNVTLFNWFSLRRMIEYNKLMWEANKEQVAKVQNDVALLVATNYLQVLLNREQVNIARITSQNTALQLENTRKRVDAGVLPELTALQLEAQLARDSSLVISSLNAFNQAILTLKSALNLDAAAPFDVDTPPVDRIPVEPLADLQPDAVYAIATTTLPQQKINDFRIDAAKRLVQASRAQMYPTISAFGGLGTNYVNIRVPDVQPGPLGPTGATVTVGATTYVVEAPTFVVVGERAVPLGRQLRNNFGQSIGIGLSVPIFNGRSARTQWERSKLTVRQEEYSKTQAQLQLKTDIYSAYNNAVASLQKYNADLKAVEANQRAYDIAVKRYDVNLLSTIDLITAQNNLSSAQFQALFSRYDYVFRMKLLEFYKGQGLKL